MEDRLEYTLRVPFKVDLTRFEPIAETDIKWNIDNLSLKVRIQDKQCLFKITGFDSEIDAKSYINRLWAGMMWITLNRHVPFRVNLQLQEVEYTADPYEAARNIERNFNIKVDRVDGIITDDSPAIYLSNKSLRALGIGEARVTVSDNFQRIFPLFESIVILPESANVVTNAKLRLALELYSGHFYEISDRAKFITLVIVLESLCEPNPKDQIIQDLLSKWQDEVRTSKSNFDPEDDNYGLLDAMEKDMFWKNYNSISNQIKNVVRKTLQSADHPSASKLGARAYEIYELRGKLVHQGFIPDDELVAALTDLKTIVQNVLRIKFCQIIGKTDLIVES